MLTDQPLRALLAAFASPRPTPGGGSAAATSSAIGVALLQMVAGLPKTRSGSESERAALGEAAAALPGVQQQLTEAIDEDTAAYEAVVAAYKEPKGTDAERAARQAAIQRTLRRATDVPLAIGRLSAAALKQAEVVAAHGHRAAASDAGVAVGLLRAGLHGAALNVEANLAGMSDAPYKEATAAEISRLKRSGDEAAAAAEQLLARG